MRKFALVLTAALALTVACVRIRGAHDRDRDDDRLPRRAHREQGQAGRRCAERGGDVRLYERSGDGWRSFASRRVPGTYFWNTVTAGHAVCRLDVRTAGDAPGFRSVAVVQLLVTPSIGCGRAQSFPLVSAP